MRPAILLEKPLLCKDFVTVSTCDGGTLPASDAIPSVSVHDSADLGNDDNRTGSSTSIGMTEVSEIKVVPPKPEDWRRESVNVQSLLKASISNVSGLGIKDTKTDN